MSICRVEDSSVSPHTAAVRAITLSAVVGLVAAGITYLFVTRPRWRSQVMEMTHLALDVVGNVFKHHE